MSIQLRTVKRDGCGGGGGDQREEDSRDRQEERPSHPSRSPILQHLYRQLPGALRGWEGEETS